MIHVGDEHIPLLSGWATLTQVSRALNIPRSAVRSAARRALKRGEPWVKKEAGDNGLMLLDTQHEDYFRHALRWQAQQTAPETSASANSHIIATDRLETDEASVFSTAYWPPQWSPLATDGLPTGPPSVAGWLRRGCRSLRIGCEMKHTQP